MSMLQRLKLQEQQQKLQEQQLKHKRNAWIRLALVGVVILSLMRWLSSVTRDDHRQENVLPDQQQTNDHNQQMQRRRIKVFSIQSNHPNARKQRQDLASSSSSSSFWFEHVVMNQAQQRLFLEKASPKCSSNKMAALARFDELLNYHHRYQQQPQLAAQVWYYCAMLVHEGGVLLDPSLVLLVPLETLLFQHDHHHNNHHPNTTTSTTRRSTGIIVNDPQVAPHSLLGSLLYLPRHSSSSVCHAMLKLLLDTPIQELITKPLLLPNALYQLLIPTTTTTTTTTTTIEAKTKEKKEEVQVLWLEQKCHVNPMKPNHNNHNNNGDTPEAKSHHHHHHSCPPETGYCCHVYYYHHHHRRDNDENNDERSVPVVVVAMTRHSLFPYQVLPPPDQLVKPFNNNTNNTNTGSAYSYDPEDLPYMSTIRQQLRRTMFRRRKPLLSAQSSNNNNSNNNNSSNNSNNSNSSIQSAYDYLSEKKCLPSTECIYCLRTVFQPTSCSLCLEQCDCYCRTLCQIPKRIVPHNHHTDSSIITTTTTHKNMILTPPVYQRDPSRLIPRIIHQTWFEEIKVEFYPHTSRMVESFRQNRGGWEYRFYTDDMAAAFLSTHFPHPVRQVYDTLLPGAFKADLFRYCVLLIHGGLYADVDILLTASNLDVAIDRNVGFMAPLDSVPGVNEHRRMCVWNGFMAAAPGHPFLLKAVEMVVNHARKRFTVVDYDHMFCPNTESSIVHANDILFTAGPCLLGAAVNHVLGRPGLTQIDEGELPIGNSANGTRIPGRTIIMSSNKTDLGAQYFTLWDKNLIVAGTDFLYSDDRNNPGKKHYSTVHNMGDVYGVEGLYVDQERVLDEEVRLYT